MTTLVPDSKHDLKTGLCCFDLVRWASPSIALASPGTTVCHCRAVKQDLHSTPRARTFPSSVIICLWWFNEMLNDSWWAHWLCDVRANYKHCDEYFWPFASTATQSCELFLPGAVSQQSRQQGGERERVDSQQLCIRSVTEAPEPHRCLWSEPRQQPRPFTFL